jgi:hypothetical protein
VRGGIGARQARLLWGLQVLFHLFFYFFLQTARISARPSRYKSTIRGPPGPAAMGPPGSFSQVYLQQEKKKAEAESLFHLFFLFFIYFFYFFTNCPRLGTPL